MMPAMTLALAGVHHAELKRHLFPGDSLEAAAILLCSRIPGPRLRLLVREVIPVPHDSCASRTRDAITWPGICIERALERGEAEALVLILVHSHPGGMASFSDIDDASDGTVIPALFQAYGDAHGSAIMLPGGEMLARLYGADDSVREIDLVSAAGDDISFWWCPDGRMGCAPRPTAFTKQMTDELARLVAVVIGVSGTGSIQAEQAARLGFGRVVLIDFDRVERRNLNRILNTTLADVLAGRLKVESLAASITEYRGPGVAVPVAASITARDAVLAASQGDVLFCCVDTLEARHIADLVAAAFLLPLVDVGVSIPVRNTAAGFDIVDAVGRVDYVQPGGSTLRDREVYSPESLRAEYLARVAPGAYATELEAGYIKGAVEEAPAVISLNMRAASAAMNEFILRAYPFRLDPNRAYARTLFSLAAAEEDHIPEDSFHAGPTALLGRGALEPLLGLPALAVPRLRQ